MNATPAGSWSRRMTTAMITAVVMVAALLGVPKSAHGQPSASTTCDRSLVVQAWQTGGSQVRSAAQTALLGSDADVCAFLTSIWQQRATVDKRLSVDQVMAAGGPATHDAAQAALDATDPAALDTFLESGWEPSHAADQRVRVDQMLAAGGAQVRAAAQRALDSTDPQALATFLDSGWQAPYQTDQRIQVLQILAGGGPEVQTAAQRALDAGDLASLTRFIEVDWPVAATRDEETAQVQDLVALAVNAGNTAAKETQAAQEEAVRAQTLAAAAKQAAAEAAADAARTGVDAKQAADAARRAAEAAKNAASAASVALSSAAQASAAARRAANAASQAASAASKTSQAAVSADMAAAAVATDASMAATARAAAINARNLAAQAKTAAEAAQHAGDLANQANGALQAARAAVTDANIAIDNATDAADDATAAGADAAAARAATADARAAANRADRAAESAISYAHTAAVAAYAARDAANRAVADAIAAAAAADEAADDAGQAAGAAARAKEDADAAMVAAQASLSAAQQAQGIYEAARTAESDQLQTSFEAADAAALSIKTGVQEQEGAEEWDGPQGAKRSAQTNQLIAVASDPTTPQAQAVSDARQVAFTLATSDGAWTAAAAVSALGDDDVAVLDYVRNGIAVAAGQDDRLTLQDLLAVGGTDGFETAGKAALDGTDADVAQFLTTRDYSGRPTDDRVAVNQAIAFAQSKGYSVVVQRGQQALDDGSDQAMWAFLVSGQYDAATTDERLQVDQILSDPNSGPELKDAAQVALDGPGESLGQFLTVTRYQAAQRDQDTAAHDLTVSTLLTQATAAATTAMQNAYEAEAAAATARGAAADAANYAAEAANSAGQALAYAQSAQESAAQAQASAARAAASANTAVAAAKSADASASDAALSAVAAAKSAMDAAALATEAHAEAEQARAAALAAGADAKTALDAASAIIQDFGSLPYNIELYECSELPMLDHEDCVRNLMLKEQNPVLYQYMNSSICELLYNPDYNSAPAGQKKQSPYDDCIRDALSPTFDQDNALTIGTMLLNEEAQIAQWTLNLELLDVGAVCVELCEAGMKLLQPIFFPELIGVPIIGTDLIAGGVIDLGIDNLLKQETIDALVDDADLARLVTNAMNCATPNSFAPKTPVLLADGTSRPIQDIRVGDRVVSTDPVTGVTEPEPVTDTITGEGRKQLVDVTIDTDGSTGSATATLTATDNHPFWVPDLAEWIDAGNLQVGQLLRTSTGTWVQVSAVAHHTEQATVHNLAVANHHTYYVTAGQASVLVHNENACAPLALGIDKYGFRQWAESNGYDHYVSEEWKVDNFSWRGPVKYDILNPNKPLKVRLDGFGDNPATDPLNAFLAAARRAIADNLNGKGTETEMAWIALSCYAGRDWNAIDFYYNGQKVAMGPEPDWWNLIGGDSDADVKLRKSWQSLLTRTKDLE